MTLPAVKLTIVIERLLQPAVEKLLTDAGVSGWSAFPGGGRGTHGIHCTGGARLVREFSIVKIETVLRDRVIAERIAETLTKGHLSQQSGIVWLSPVEVWRAGKF